MDIDLSFYVQNTKRKSLPVGIFRLANECAPTPTWINCLFIRAEAFRFYRVLCCAPCHTRKYLQCILQYERTISTIHSIHVNQMNWMNNEKAQVTHATVYLHQGLEHSSKNRKQNVNISRWRKYTSHKQFFSHSWLSISFSNIYCGMISKKLIFFMTLVVFVSGKWEYPGRRKRDEISRKMTSMSKWFFFKVYIDCDWSETPISEPSGNGVWSKCSLCFIDFDDCTHNVHYLLRPLFLLLASKSLWFCIAHDSANPLRITNFLTQR